jgi:hypothetical protein
LAKPQFEQIWVNRAPHMPQNFIAGRFSKPQLGHFIDNNYVDPYPYPGYSIPSVRK